MSEKQYSKVYFLCQAQFCIILLQGVTSPLFLQSSEKRGIFLVILALPPGRVSCWNGCSTLRRTAGCCGNIPSLTGKAPYYIVIGSLSCRQKNQEWNILFKICHSLQKLSLFNCAIYYSERSDVCQQVLYNFLMKIINAYDFCIRFKILFMLYRTTFQKLFNFFIPLLFG